MDLDAGVDVTDRAQSKDPIARKSFSIISRARGEGAP